MITLLVGLGTAVVVWWLLKWFSRTSPARVATLVRQVGGGLAFLTAAILLVRGRFDMAFLLGSGGAWLLGWNGLPAPFGGRRPIPAKSAGAVSRVRSALLEMELDHDTGAIEGRVLAGNLADRPLASLTRGQVLALHGDCLAQDPEGVRLVEAYLDRRFAGWREDAEPDADGRGRPDPKRDAMTQQEAYEVLGLEPGADPDAVRAAHRALMKRLHPDGGGSTYLASRVNQAKDILLDRHR